MQKNEGGIFIRYIEGVCDVSPMDIFPGTFHPGCLPHRTFPLPVVATLGHSPYIFMLHVDQNRIFANHVCMYLLSIES